ncbi:amidase [Marinobacterium nitratireducens]|uniref:Amidase n=1 Tax=Marinobacterium nitratireducens TaxID=518897 RepID=A0A917ZBB5_9GAMM|nr:amidase [Marinobacterium nitratireducens]GGO79294.1 amidase [Marinobacterium nitratireducens]
MTTIIDPQRRNFLRTSAGLGALTMAASALPAWAAKAGSVNSPEQLLGLSALELSAAIKAGKVSCVEVMQSYLDQIEKYNPTYNAIVSLRPREELLAEAKQADAELNKGLYRGWMHGFPHAVKDLAATRGIATTMGSPILKNWVPEHDAIFVERLRSAGAIIIGKTNTPEFGLGSQSYNTVFGVTRNAWDSKLCAGGSSGGAAVALAASMVPVADGSDMMGSLRNPAAYNNVIGFRPTQGRVPFGPTSEVWYQQLGYEGPMGRNVRDTAQLLSTMAGFDARVPMSLESDPAQFAGSLDINTRGMKVAWLGDFNGYLPMEDGVLSLCESAFGRFDDIGCSVEAVDMQYPMDELWQTWLTLRHFLIAGIASGLYAKEENRALMKPEALWEIEGGLALSGADVYAASKARTRWYLALNKLFETYDVVALPSAQVFPFDAETHWPKEVAGKSMDTYHRWMEVVIPGTLSGCPVANVPVGFDAKGRPMGIQLIGPAKQDLKVLQIAHAYEQASGLTAKKPTLV